MGGVRRALAVILVVLGTLLFVWSDQRYESGLRAAFLFLEVRTHPLDAGFFDQKPG